jgi:hypothetical protein
LFDGPELSAASGKDDHAEATLGRSLDGEAPRAPLDRRLRFHQDLAPHLEAGVLDLGPRRRRRRRG